MAPRVDGTSNNQEFFNPVDLRIEQPVAEQTPLDLTDRNLLFRQNNLGGDTLRVNLFAQFDRAENVVPVRQTPPAVNQDKVRQAVESIQSRLDQGITDWDVSHGDLTSIRNTFRGLNAAEANEVFRALSDGNLTTWANELDGASGGFSTQEKKTLFNELAAKLDGQQLARLTNALGDEENIQALADSVANRASDATKVDLINRMSENVERNGGLAIGVAELIGGLRNNPRSLEGVLDRLSPAQLSAVVQAASQQEIHSTASPYGGGSVYTTFDPAPLVDMLNAVSRTNNAELKAEVFQAAALELKRIEEAGGIFNPAVGRGDAARDVRNALTGMLQRDTTGIMRELEHNFRNGEGITAYAKSMLKAGETRELGNIIARLSKGNSLTGDPLARFGTQVRGMDGNPHYQNAQVLGYFAGGLFAGAKQITSDRTKQADMLKNVFGTIAGATGAANPAAGVASSIVNGLTQAAVTEITDGLNRSTMSMEEALEKLIFPRSAQTGDTYEGAAEADYDSSFSRVVLRNQ